MSLQGWQPHGAQPQPYGQSSMMRASDADRERTTDVLKAGFAEGRLQQKEFEDRLTRVQRSSTYGELQALVADLPQGPMQQPHPPQPPQQAYYGPARPMAMPLPPPTNGNATGALVCGLLTLFSGGATAIPAVILGHKARAEIRRTGEQGDGQAITGLVFGYLSIAAWVIFILALVLLFSA
ncbi:DUF1707 and DUF4190 domain-containing protein [Streptomyces sp. 6N223]|uniref:DUF1707 and DUF4190 domain-containing protein n=1 Tax=Streptomyces sp. 6N223 TaxID=3457412 RepID=UPI003FCF8281